MARALLDTKTKVQFILFKLPMPLSSLSFSFLLYFFSLCEIYFEGIISHFQVQIFVTFFISSGFHRPRQLMNIHVNLNVSC